MSTDIQLKGDSRRRQLEKSRDYAQLNGLELAAEHELEDIGISAFKGANLKEGALGKFLEAVKSGAVPKGSYLIVESLDRITRQKLEVGLADFLSIINAGVTVVTLMDQRVYSAGKMDLQHFMMSLVTMSRAHDESAAKSHRGLASWENKRSNAVSGRPMTKWAPAWLKLSEDRSHYEVVPQRAEVVRKIFSEAAAGIGMYTIANRLNASGIPTFNKSKGWHQSYVAKILGNRAVIGEFHPGVRDKDGRRVVAGRPIADFYPAVVEEQLFFRAQHGKDQRRQNAAGRKGHAFANLFSGLATCIYCGGSISYENKGSGPKGGAYLVCNGARRRLGCVAQRWRYKDFEATFLAFVRELDLRSILSASNDRRKQAELTAEIDSLNGEILSIDALMDKTYALLEGEGPVTFVKAKLKELEGRREAATMRLAVTKDAKATLDAREERFRFSREEINTLVSTLQGAPSSELFELRAQIASRLKSIVASLRIASIGSVRNDGLMKTPVNEIMNQSEGESIQLVSMLADLPDPPRRYFAVTFENEMTRIVYPQYGDPLAYELQVMARKGEGFSVDRSKALHP